MPNNHTHGEAAPRLVDRREFLKHAGRGGVGATVFLAGAGRAGRASAQSVTPYPDWIPMSTKAPKRGGVMTRASSWDPPVLDPRLTQSVVQPYVRNASALSLRRTDGYGSAAIARVWLDK